MKDYTFENAGYRVTFKAENDKAAMRKMTEVGLYVYHPITEIEKVFDVKIEAVHLIPTYEAIPKWIDLPHSLTSN